MRCARRIKMNTTDGRTEPEEVSTSSVGSDSDSDANTRAKNSHASLLGSFILGKSNANSSHRNKRCKVEKDKSANGRKNLGDRLTTMRLDENVSLKATFEDCEMEDREEETDPFVTHFVRPDATILEQASTAHGIQWSDVRQEDTQFGRLYQRRRKGDVSIVAVPSHLKHKLRTSISSLDINVTKILHSSLAKHMFAYEDVLFPQRNISNAPIVRTLTAIHVVNHVYKTRDRILKNNLKLAHVSNQDDSCRDQGFTRPKILYILPTRNSCFKVVETLIQVAQSERQENKDRFQKSFFSKDEISDRKPEDFRDLFGGNDDDMFRIGIKFTRKTLKLYSAFYNSDIVLASPLGLRMALGEEADQKFDSDWLSSIEVVILDQADAMLMQNWEHMQYVFKHLNNIPKDPHGCDFSRVRNWYLDGKAKYLRQTIISSQFTTPEINSLFSKHSSNLAGSLRICPQFNGELSRLALSIRQTFFRFDSPDPLQEPDFRFRYFTSVVLPSIREETSSKQGVLLFIPAYPDFVRIRNHLSKIDVSAGLISEYNTTSTIARARSHFLTGRQKLLLYTERAHHFRRYVITGVSQVLFYGLPSNPVFYNEIMEMLLKTVGFGEAKVEDMNASVIFSRWDSLKLERIVGTSWQGIMCKSREDTFEFP